MASPEFNFSLLTAPLEQRDQRKLEQRVMAYTAPQLEYCNVASAASGEQIVGTAPLLQIAVAIELPAKDWDVFRDAALRNERRLELSARAARAGLRFALLILKPRARRAALPSSRCACCAAKPASAPVTRKRSTASY